MPPRSLRIVPPPNNLGWPEVAIYQGIRYYTRVTPLIPLGEEHIPPEDEYGYSAAINTHRRLCRTVGTLPKNSALLFTELDPILPGLHALRPDLYLSSLIHGGSFIPGDTMPWPPFLEQTTLEALDVVLSACVYHADLMRAVYYSTKIEITPYPLPHILPIMAEATRIKKEPRRSTVLFPHRCIPEKGYPEFLEASKLWSSTKGKNPVEWRVVRGLDRKDFYRVLSEVKIIYAHPTMEVFGNAVEEGLAMGCCPVFSRHPSYVKRFENVGVHWHDGTPEDICRATEEALECQEDHYHFTEEENRTRATRIIEISRG